MRKKSHPYCSFQYPSFYYYSFDDKQTQNNDTTEKEKHECHVCCKGFPSNKALNGHMRVHNKDKKAIPQDEFQFQLSSPNIDLSNSGKSHKCSKRNKDINTNIDNEGDRKRPKLLGIMINEKISEQVIAPTVSGIDETIKMKVKDLGVEIQDS